VSFVIIHLILAMHYILGDVPHHPINTNEAMECSRMANGRAETAIDTNSEGR
jgi:hypothetical protein